MSSDDFNRLIAPYRGNIVLDIGTGDGKFVYRQARRNPHKFYIGIEPNARALAKVSEKIYRKPSRGGAPNLLFLRASVEDLPVELQSIANQVFVLFPWGSLLRAVAGGDSSILRALRSICVPEAAVEIIIGLEPTRDRSEMKRLRLPSLTPEYWNDSLIQSYRSSGWDIRVEQIESIPDQYLTSWAARLRFAPKRAFYLISGQAMP